MDLTFEKPWRWGLNLLLNIVKKVVYYKTRNSVQPKIRRRPKAFYSLPNVYFGNRSQLQEIIIIIIIIIM